MTLRRGVRSPGAGDLLVVGCPVQCGFWELNFGACKGSVPINLWAISSAPVLLFLSGHYSELHATPVVTVFVHSYLQLSYNNIIIINSALSCF